MSQDIHSLVHRLRSRRKELNEMKKIKIINTKSLIKFNLSIFKYIIDKNQQMDNFIPSIKEDMILILEDRLKKIEEYSMFQIDSIFNKLIFQNIEAFNVQNIIENSRENFDLRSLDKNLELLYSIMVLRKKLKDENNNPKSDLYITLSITAICHEFFNRNDNLSAMFKVELDSPHSNIYFKLFNRAFYLYFKIEEMKNFILNKKIKLLADNLQKIFNLESSHLEMLISYRFYEHASNYEVLRELETSNMNPTRSVKKLLKGIYQTLEDHKSSTKHKSFVLSYILFKYKGLIKYIETKHFLESPSYYYVYWIDYFKESRLKD